MGFTEFDFVDEFTETSKIDFHPQLLLRQLLKRFPKRHQILVIVLLILALNVDVLVPLLDDVLQVCRLSNKLLSPGSSLLLRRTRPVPP